MTKTAELYGGSLYDLAVEENSASAMMEELDGILKIFKENPDYPGSFQSLPSPGPKEFL